MPAARLAYRAVKLFKDPGTLQQVKSVTGLFRFITRGKHFILYLRSSDLYNKIIHSSFYPPSSPWSSAPL
jgi:hypothetical protein